MQALRVPGRASAWSTAVGRRRTSAGQCRSAPPQATTAAVPKLAFRQLFDSDIIGDAGTGQAAIIDSVVSKVDRDLQVAHEMGLTLVLDLNTHAHADHVTGTAKIKEALPGVRSAMSAASGVECVDVKLQPFDELAAGGVRIKVLATPGHTAGCVSFLLPDHGVVFTGDALLIRGCGRTDFQQGDSAQLYESVHGQLFSLPDDTNVYPAHDYQGRTASTIGEERRFNPRLSKPLPEFVQIMANLNLPYPKQIDKALPANLMCGA